MKTKRIIALVLSAVILIAAAFGATAIMKRQSVAETENYYSFSENFGLMKKRSGSSPYFYYTSEPISKEKGGKRLTLEYAYYNEDEKCLKIGLELLELSGDAEFRENHDQNRGKTAVVGINGRELKLKICNKDLDDENKNVYLYSGKYELEPDFKNEGFEVKLENIVIPFTLEKVEGKKTLDGLGKTFTDKNGVTVLSVAGKHDGDDVIYLFCQADSKRFENASIMPAYESRLSFVQKTDDTKSYAAKCELVNAVDIELDDFVFAAPEEKLPGDFSEYTLKFNLPISVDLSQDEVVTVKKDGSKFESKAVLLDNRFEAQIKDFAFDNEEEGDCSFVLKITDGKGKGQFHSPQPSLSLLGADGASGIGPYAERNKARDEFKFLTRVKPGQSEYKFLLSLSSVSFWQEGRIDL